MSRNIKDGGGKGIRGPMPWLVLAACVLFILTAGHLLWRVESNPDQSYLDSRQKAELVTSGFAAAEHLLVASSNLAQERGLTYKVLKSTGRIPDDAREMISQVRRKGDEALTTALALMNEQAGFGSAKTFISRAQENMKTLQDERAAIDKLDRGGDIDRNTRLANSWFATTSRLLISNQQLLEVVQARIRTAGNDVDTAVALKVQRLAFIMIDFVGRERGVVSGAIAEARPLEESVSRWILPAYRGRIAVLWTSVAAAADSKALSPEIESLVAKVQTEYFQGMEPLRDQIQQSSKKRQPYPVTAEEWFAQATGVIDSIVSLGQKAGQFAQSKSGRYRKSV